MKRISTLLFGMLVFFTYAFAQSQPQAWDLGAEQLTGYENMLNADIINSAYSSDIVAGTSGITIPSAGFNFAAQNFVYSTNGATNHRLRTTNTAITRYDEKNRKDASGNIYSGYIYSNTNNDKNPNVYVQQTFEVNDLVEYYVSSNGGAAEYHFVAPDKSEQLGNYTAAAQCEKLTFAVAVTGTHKLYCAQGEKLCVARVIRRPATYVHVEGAITAPDDFFALSDAKVVVTNKSNGWRAESPVQNGRYSVELPDGFEFEFSLLGADEFAISEGKTLVLAGAATHDITLEGVDLETLTGKVTGLSAEALQAVEFVFSVPEGHVFIPRLTLDRSTGDFSLVKEKGVDINFTALNVNDYEGSVVVNEDETVIFAFTLLPRYKVTIVPTGASLADLEQAVFTFTNLVEEGYVYVFTGPDNIELRDGRYSVKVTNAGIYSQLLTSDLVVNLAPVSKQIDFTADIHEWVFADDDFVNGGYTNNSAEYTYKTLVFKGGKSHNNTYLYAGNGATINVPVSGQSNVIVSVCYEYHLSIDGTVLCDAKTGSTGQIDEFTYNYNGGAGVVTINATGTSYITAIRVEDVAEYKAELHVGAGQEFETINAALAYARRMPDVQNKGVKLLIEPGNYEEMLVIDIANLQMVNASATPSIALANQGVDIDPNAVRITSYYGVGYNYASMNPKYLWDERYQQVGIENNAPTVENTSNGGTATMWNATVRVEAKNFRADNIIFENSFNQYISEKESKDLVFVQAAMPARPTTAGDVSVQERRYRERACAISFNKNADRGILNNCRVVGRQDAIYGAETARVAVNGGVLMGAVDYIFGGMTLACRKTDLSMLVSLDKNDATYITAAQQNSGVRGFLFMDCHIVSALPNVEMAESEPAKPGYFGRPWSKTGEAVFVNTRIDETHCTGYSGSLIAPAGWNSSLSGEGTRCYEYNSQDAVDNTAARAAWSVVLDQPQLPDGTLLTLFNFTKGKDNWNPFDELPNITALETIGGDDSMSYTVVDGRLRMNVTGEARVRVYSATGLLVDDSRVSGEYASQILPQGMYVVVADSASSRKAAKFLVR